MVEKQAQLDLFQQDVAINNLDSDIFVCLDIECTGFNKEEDNIIEVAAVKFTKDKKLATFKTFLKAHKEIPIIIQDLTGITNQMVESAPELEEIADELRNFVGNAPIIGHNIDFDLDFLEAKGVTFPGIRIDTLPLSQTVVRDVSSYSLETLSHHFSEHQPTHRALDDVLANIELFWKLIEFWQAQSNQITKHFLEHSSIPLREILLSTNNEQLVATEFTMPQKSVSEKAKEIIVTTPTELAEQINQDENLEEIVPHQHTINPQKWQAFSTKTEYDDEETYLGLKIAVQITNNSLPKTTNLALHNSGFSLVHKLTNQTPIITLKKEHSYIVSHRYFFQEIEQFSGQNINFKNQPFLQETFVRARSRYVSMQDFPETATITFGRLGMWFNQIKSEKDHMYLLSDDEINSNEFQTIMQALAEYDVALPDFERDFIWLENKYNQPPLIGFLTKNSNYDLDILAERYQLNSTVIEDTQKETVQLMIQDHLPEPNNFGFKKALETELEVTINDSDRDICLLATSYDQIKHLFNYCLKKYPHRNVIAQQYSGSAGKIRHKLETATDHNVLICTYQFYLKHKPQLPHLDKLFLVKLPMNTPNHPFYIMQKQNNRNFFMEYVVPHAAANLYHTLAVNPNCPANILLDCRLKTKSYGATIIKLAGDSINFS